MRWVLARRCRLTQEGETAPEGDETLRVKKIVFFTNLHGTLSRKRSK